MVYGTHSSILVSEMTKVSITLLTVETNDSNLFRREFRFKWLKMMLFLYLTRRSNIEGFVDDIGEWCLVHLGSICCFRRKGEMALQESFLTINKMHKTDIIPNYKQDAQNRHH